MGVIIHIDCNVGKTIVNHPPNHRFYRGIQGIPSHWSFIVDHYKNPTFIGKINMVYGIIILYKN